MNTNSLINLFTTAENSWFLTTVLFIKRKGLQKGTIICRKEREKKTDKKI
jgi:hypothetical protein